MEQSNSYRVLPIHIDSIVNISENEIKIYAYNKTISDLNEDSVIIDSINIDIQLEKEHIRKLSYTIDMPLSEYKAIRFANERIYGNVDYYDISEYRHVCGWRIGKDYMYLNYILSAQQTELSTSLIKAQHPDIAILRHNHRHTKTFFKKQHKREA